ncbi:hypothetical protein SLS62_006521 [Diatrype stigma]|uniref:FAD-binding PCMH-type domain-containing protein n=1 Tax=Diatrype stigma TaxID=117547 RepID=A0AAN9UPD3_9PEZI
MSASPKGRAKTPPASGKSSPLIAVIAVAVGIAAIALGLWYQTATTENGGDGASTLAVAVINATAVAATCAQLRGELGAAAVTLPSDAAYPTLREKSFSQTAWKHPACIARPASAADVQKLVGALVANDVPFAVRSGGHSFNPGDASIDGGVLIALDNLNEVTYDAATGLASLGPGARWDAVYTVLDEYDVTVVGGRVMDVGVGGLMLGGGLSYLSDLYGLACDNVVSFEVVLADGSVVVATSTEHPDLFWALKGGANNFGIVTQFKLTTYPIKQVWGGMQVYGLDQMPALLQAYHAYQNAPNKDLHANLCINLVPTNASLVLTMVYLKPVERPAAFAPFYELLGTPLFEATGFMTLHELMGGFPASAVPRWTSYVSTFAQLSSSDLFAHQLDALLSSSAPDVAAIAALQAGTLVATLQPVSEHAVRAGEARGGGNALGLRPVNQTWLAINVAWWDEKDDAVARASAESLHAQAERVLRLEGEEGDEAEAGARKREQEQEYIFMNDANAKQPVIASYGDANVRRLRAVQETYDPHLVFQRLVPGGFKIPPLA